MAGTTKMTVIRLISDIPILNILFSNTFKGPYPMVSTQFVNLADIFP